MLLTEDEAKERWCPFARVVKMGLTPEPGTYNRVVTYSSHRIAAVDLSEDESPENEAPQYIDALGTHIDLVPHSCRCLGSACAAWRWAKQRNLDAMEHYEAAAPKDESAPPKLVGYCGLATPPEDSGA